MEKDLYLSMMGAYDEVYLRENPVGNFLRNNIFYDKDKKQKINQSQRASSTLNREGPASLGTPLTPAQKRYRQERSSSENMSPRNSSIVPNRGAFDDLTQKQQEGTRQRQKDRDSKGLPPILPGSGFTGGASGIPNQPRRSPNVSSPRNTTQQNDSQVTPKNSAVETKTQEKVQSTNQKYDILRKSSPSTALAYGRKASERIHGSNTPKTPNPLLSRPASTTSAVPQMSGSASASTGSKPSTPSSSLNTPKPKTFNAINPRMRSRMESMDNQRYHSMRDAYKAMYEAKVVVGKGPALQAAVVLPKPSVTKVNVEVNPQETKVGDVDQAYYTFPAGFDPTNREDVASKSKKVEYKAEEVEVTDEEFFEFMVENGITESLESAEAIFEHMSDEWFDSIYTGLIEAKNAEGKEQGLDGKACWKGYRRAGTKQKGGKTVDNCVKM